MDPIHSLPLKTQAEAPAQPKPPAEDPDALIVSGFSFRRRKPPAKDPHAGAPAPPQDSVDVGQDKPSLAFRALRGLAGVAGGAVSSVVGASIGGVKHAGDRSIELPKSAVSTLRIAGAALGLIKGVALGLAAGPLGVVVGAVCGPILGAWSGGALAGGVEGAVDALKGAASGAKEGYLRGSEWATSLVDNMAGKEPGDGKPAAGQPTAPRTITQPDPAVAEVTKPVEDTTVKSLGVLGQRAGRFQGSTLRRVVPDHTNQLPGPVEKGQSGPQASQSLAHRARVGAGQSVPGGIRPSGEGGRPQSGSS